MAEFADRVMQKYSGADEPDGDEAPSDGAAPDAEAGESDGDVALAAIKSGDGSAFEQAMLRITGK